MGHDWYLTTYSLRKIRMMDLGNSPVRKSCQIIFAGEKLNMEAVWKVRDVFFPPVRAQK